MSTLPNWNQRQQRQDYQNSSYAVPMSADHEVTELTWENGQLGMHGVHKSATTATTTTNTAYGGDTLESIVHQATYHQRYGLMNMEPENQKNEQPNSSNNTPTAPPPMGKEVGQVQMLIPPYTGVVKKRARMESESDQCGRYLSNSSRMLHDLGEERSGCASAGATFCRDNFNKDATFVTWGSSFDTPPAQSFKIKTTDFDDSASHGGGMVNNNDEEQETKGGSLGTCSARRSRAAAVHNQSERRRRDRINQKMKALQKLVPNANKTDKASMLDEVIDYLKQLQAQVDHMMSSRTIVPQTQMMVNTLAMQQQMQMSLLASRMGSMPAFGMFDLNAMAMARIPPHPSLQSGLPINPAASLASSGSAFMPTGIPTPTTTTTTSSGTSAHGLNPFNHPYNAFLAQQTGNMDYYSKMAALYRHDQANQARSNPPSAKF